MIDYPFGEAIASDSEAHLTLFTIVLSLTKFQVEKDKKDDKAA